MTDREGYCIACNEFSTKLGCADADVNAMPITGMPKYCPVCARKYGCKNQCGHRATHQGYCPGCYIEVLEAALRHCTCRRE